MLQQSQLIRYVHGQAENKFIPHKLVATLFNVSCTSRVTGHIRAARKDAKNNFTIHNVGFDAIPREKVIKEYTTDLTRELFADGKKDVLILIMDGTYIYLGITNHQAKNNYLQIHFDILNFFSQFNIPQGCL